MTINQLMHLHDKALIMSAFPETQWPPSIYYRFLGLIALEMKADVFVELGTCGGGASYNVGRISPNTKIISIDITKLDQVSLIEKKCPNFEFVQGDSIKLAQTIGSKYKNRIDLLFIDTVHTYEHVTAEFNAWLPYLKPGSVICCDDLYCDGMNKFWDEIKYAKTGMTDLALMHIGGMPNDGGFGAIII